jgi:hypothetical protein
LAHQQPTRQQVRYPPPNRPLIIIAQNSGQKRWRLNAKEQVLESPAGHGITDIPFRASGSTCFVIIWGIVSSATKRRPYLSSP